jgi:hypothetical protein
MPFNHIIDHNAIAMSIPLIILHVVVHYDVIIISRMTGDHEHTMSSKLVKCLIITNKPCDDNHTINRILNKVSHHHN